MSATAIRRLIVLPALLAGALLCPWAAEGQDTGFACPQAPAGWSLDRVPPRYTKPKPGAKLSEEWDAACLYAEEKATVRVSASLTEGGTADAEVHWTETSGACPLPTLNLGSMFSDLGSVDGELAGHSRRAVATYSFEPVDDPFHGGMKQLAAQLLSDAEARAGECTNTSAASGDDGSPSDKEIEIAAGLILTLLGGGGLFVPGRAGSDGGESPSSDPNPGSPPQQPDSGTHPPVVTITSPGQGDEVGEYVAVTGTVTGAISVFATAPGGGGAGTAVGGTFSVNTRVGVRNAAIVVEAVNADGTGRAAVHVFRPGAPEWLPDDEDAHTQALIAQKDAAQAAELASYQAAVHAGAQPPAPPASAPTHPAAIAPKSFDELIGRLTSPGGGEVAISPGDAANVLPSSASWAKHLITDIGIQDQVVTVQTPLGSAAGTLWADSHGRLIYDPTTIFSDQDMVSKNVADKIQTGLDGLTNRIGRSGLRVVDARVEAGRVWIRTAPK